MLRHIYKAYSETPLTIGFTMFEFLLVLSILCIAMHLMTLTQKTNKN